MDFDMMDETNIEGDEPITTDTLGKITGEQFNEKISASPFLNCMKCLKRLSPPIMLIKDVGNVCGTCKDEFGCDLAVHNFTFEEFLNRFPISCINGDKGCKSKGNISDIVGHERLCGYRMFKCPLHLYDACNWEGSLACLKDHFSQEHGNFLHVCEDDYFRLDLDVLSRDTETIQLLCNDGDNFILRIKYDNAELKLRLFMYWIKREKADSDFTYNAQIENCDCVDHYYISDCVDNVVLQVMHVPETLDNNAALNLNLSFVKMSHSSIVTVYINVRNQMYCSMDDKLDHSVLKMFKCPSCFHFMKPPICLCIKGHSFCKKCKLKFMFCPICDTVVSNAHNYALEEFSKGVQFPCDNYSRGCCAVMTGFDIAEHELFCPFQFVYCPLPKCDWKGNNSGIVGHFKETHRGTDVIYGNHHSMSVSLKDMIFYMVFDEQLFCFFGKFSGIKLLYTIVHLVATVANRKMYKYEVGLIDDQDVQKRVILTGTCNELPFSSRFNPTKLLHDCIGVPLATVNELPQKLTCQLYCRIARRVDGSPSHISKCLLY